MNTPERPRPDPPLRSGNPQTHDLAPAVQPPQVPDYELIRRIGHGAYGDVWLARSQATGAMRAAKIVWRHTFEEERPFKREFEGIQRFERISREHPSQLALFHIGRNEAQGYFYYVMELADPVSVAADVRRLTTQASGARNPKPEIKSEPPDVGCYTPHTLRADLEHGRLPAAKVLEIGLALTEALSHLHSNGLVHRDVKPSNVIFVNDRPKLADIGLVTDASDQCSIVGTEGYLPPEGPGTPQADIFALGKVLYEAATGLDRREFPKLPEDLRIWPDAAQVFELNEIILKACAHDSGHRYQTCDETHADLSLLEHGKSVRQKRTWQKRRMVAKIVLVVVAMFGVAAWLRPHSPPATRPGSTNSKARAFYDRAVLDLQSQAWDRGRRAYGNLFESVKLDPRFLDAHYLMFEANLYAGSPPDANYRIAEKLRELAPNSEQYHTVNSMIKFNEWSFEEAIAEAQLAIQINPKFMRAHALYGWYLELAYGDATAAMNEYERAEELDSKDTILQSIKGDAFYLGGYYNQAITQYNKTILQSPPSSLGFFNLARAYEAAGNFTNALEALEQADSLGGIGPEQARIWHDALLRDLLTNGPSGMWETRLHQVIHDPRGANNYHLATLYARLGDKSNVIASLNLAFRGGDPRIKYLLEDHWFDPLRGESNFISLVKEVGFPKFKPGLKR